MNGHPSDHAAVPPRLPAGGGDFIGRLLGAAGEAVRPRLAPLYDPAPPRLRSDDLGGSADAAVTVVASIEDGARDKESGAAPPEASKSRPLAAAEPSVAPATHRVLSPSAVEARPAAGSAPPPLSAAVAAGSYVPAPASRLARDEHPEWDTVSSASAPPPAPAPLAPPAGPAMLVTAAGPPRRLPGDEPEPPLGIPVTLPTRHLVRPAPPQPPPRGGQPAEPTPGAGGTARRAAIPDDHRTTGTGFEARSAIPVPPPSPRRQRAPERTVHITIDRLEVRAPATPAAPPRKPARQPAMSLEEHLRQRGGRRT